MVRDRGIILRKVPYSDSASVINCFALDHGQISLFTRVNKKSTAGHLQIGSFISFTAKSKPNSDLYTLVESQWDQDLPSQPLPAEALGVWAFCLELLYKSLSPSFPIPLLLHKVSSYYAHLSLSDISLHPYIPLCLIMHSAGISDLTNHVSDEAIMKSLQLFELLADDSPREAVPIEHAFKSELQRFQRHFNVDHIDSLYLVA